MTARAVSHSKPITLATLAGAATPARATTQTPKTTTTA